MPGGAMIDTALVIVTGPYPPGLTTTTSPPETVWAIATVNNLQGAEMEHGFASLPWPETNVRCTAAPAGVVVSREATRSKGAGRRTSALGMGLCSVGCDCERRFTWRAAFRRDYQSWTVPSLRRLNGR